MLASLLSFADSFVKQLKDTKIFIANCDHEEIPQSFRFLYAVSVIQFVYVLFWATLVRSMITLKKDYNQKYRLIWSRKTHSTLLNDFSVEVFLKCC